MVCTATAQIPHRKNCLCDSGCQSDRDIFCVSLIRSLPRSHVQDASSDAAVIGFFKFQFQMGEEVWLEVAFHPSHDLIPAVELSE